MFNETIDNLVTLKEDTDTYKKVLDFIHKNKSVTKKQILDMLNWGVRITNLRSYNLLCVFEIQTVDM